MTALIFGSAAFDTIEIPGEATREKILGGSASYAAIAASFFTAPQLVSVVGRDWKEEFSARLAARGVDLRGLERRSDGETFFWRGRYFVNKDERVTAECRPGVFTPDYAPVVPEEYKGTSIVFLGNASPKSSAKLLDQLDDPKIVVADTMELYIETAREDLLKLLRRINGFTLNESEAVALTGESDPLEAARNILELGPKFVIVKLGSRGALWVTREYSESYPVYPIKAVDATGAGDAFGGAFMGTLAEFNGDLSRETVRLACLRAAVVASLNIEDFEPIRLERATRDEIDARVAELERRMKTRR